MVVQKLRAKAFSALDGWQRMWSLLFSLETQLWNLLRPFDGSKQAFRVKT
jgi:hypothetical protein